MSYCAKSIATITVTLRVRVEMRPPKEGELAWCVSADADAEEALKQVYDGRDSPDCGEHGFGWRCTRDQSEYEECRYADGVERLRNITVIVDHVRDDLKGVRSL